MKVDKNQFIQFLVQKLTKQREDLDNEIKSINEEIGKETKSSAGDKFETSREMMTQERNRLEERVNYVTGYLKSLNEMSLNAFKNIGFGSLVGTSKGLFLFGIPIGKVEFQEEPIMIVSLNSPIGKLFLDKKLNDSVSFAKTTYTITAIQ